MDRNELAARFAVALVPSYYGQGYGDDDLARDAAHKADTLMSVLAESSKSTPAPVAPPAGKYVPAVGDIVRYSDDDEAEGDKWHKIVVRVEGVAVGYKFLRDLDGSPLSSCSPGNLRYLRDSTAAEQRAAGLAVPPPATAGDDRSRGCVVAFCADHAEVEVVTGPFCPVCSMGRVLDDGVRLGRTAKWPTTPAPEGASLSHPRAKASGECGQPTGPARDGDATPAPEAKRPTHVRVTGKGCGEHHVTVGKVYPVVRWNGDDSPDVIDDDGNDESSLAKPNGADAGYWPSWEPAPCPPPVAGSAEDDVERAARALVENRGATYSVATNPPSKFVMIPSAYFEALRAALSRPVRP